jgi:micrococcal nuclease
MLRKKFADKNPLIAYIIIFTLFLSGLLASCTNAAYNQNRKEASPPEESTSLSRSANEEQAIQTEDENQTQSGTEEDYEEALVTRVIDGDTIVVLLNGREERVRLIGIDTPERGRPYFEEATRKTAEFVLGKKVKLVKDVSERDKYGRLLRYVYAGSLFVNAELVRQGFAMVYTYPPDVKYSEYFLKLQQEARENNRGLWSDQVSVHTSKSSGYYVASKRSDVFHLPDCTYARKIAPYNLIRFSSREEAINSGRRPCKVCNP